ncbi:MAG: hypothetical protein M3R31_08195 [Pseudomonadota bacterium]|nr:hypothetical protein [Pseudomonadota bacterium]
MIYVLTVHWSRDFWVDVQISHLRKYILHPFKIFAFCEGTRHDHAAKFDYCSPVKGIVDHASKLNALASVVCDSAHDDDVLIFCDSDAFPVRDITDYIRSGLARWPLVAVQRLENAGDVQPHPCFSMTTASFWRRIEGDWRAGPTWTNSHGQVVTDVGANLLRSLWLNGVEWGKMRRSNRLNLHPLLFAVYDDVVYHHGAGSRPSIGGRAVRHGELSRLDPAEAAHRSSKLQQEIADASRRLLEIISRGRDDELLALLC